MPKLMKGETFEDGLKLVRGKPRFEYPVFVEPKIDEIRCRVYLDAGGTVRWESYAEKPLLNMEFLSTAMQRFFMDTEYYELDIGIEVNGNFNDSYRWVRSKKVPDGLDSSMVKLWVFDIPTSLDMYRERVCEVLDVALELKDYGVPAEATECLRADTEEEVHQIFTQCINHGYEGAMVKTMHHLYQKKRSFDWMKLKPSADADGVILKLIEATATVADPANGIAVGDPLGRTGSVYVRMPDGSAAYPHGIKHELGRDMHQNPEKYIGEWCSFKYMHRDRQGGYRHPVFQRIREEKQCE